MAANFAPLLEYLERLFGQIDDRLDELSQRVSDLQRSVDDNAKRADGCLQEMVMPAMLTAEMP